MPSSSGIESRLLAAPLAAHDTEVASAELAEAIERIEPLVAAEASLPVLDAPSRGAAISRPVNAEDLPGLEVHAGFQRVMGSGRLQHRVDRQQGKCRAAACFLQAARLSPAGSRPSSSSSQLTIGSWRPCNPKASPPASVVSDCPKTAQIPKASLGHHPCLRNPQLRC